MDRIDHQIIHCLQRDGRAPFRVIAEAMEVSEQTVARRFRALQEAGAVRVIVMADPLAAGLEQWFVRIQCRPDSADALAEALAAREATFRGSASLPGAANSSASPAAIRQRVGVRCCCTGLPRTNQVLSFTAYSVLHMHVGGESEWMALDDPLNEAQIALLKPSVRGDPVDRRSHPRRRRATPG